MNCVRIIPRLDIKGPNLVKGINLEGLRVMGSPEEFARHYYKSGADELFFVDVFASLSGRNSIQEIVTRVANEIFIPLTVGGGLRTIEDIKSVLRSGADKVSLNTAAVKSPNLIKEAAHRFGSSTIVISIEAIQSKNGEYQVYIDNGREFTGLNVVEWAKRVEELGAGEIAITSVDSEGIGEGFNLNLIKMVSESVSIPIIAHGGAGKLADISDLLNKTNVEAVAIASMLHYHYLDSIPVDERYLPTEGNIDFLLSGKSFSKIQPVSIREIKAYLMENNINCRYE